MARIGPPKRYRSSRSPRPTCGGRGGGRYRVRLPPYMICHVSPVHAPFLYVSFEHKSDQGAPLAELDQPSMTLGDFHLHGIHVLAPTG